MRTSMPPTRPVLEESPAATMPYVIVLPENWQSTKVAVPLVQKVTAVPSKSAKEQPAHAACSVCVLQSRAQNHRGRGGFEGVAQTHSPSFDFELSLMAHPTCCATNGYTATPIENQRA